MQPCLCLQFKTRDKAHGDTRLKHLYDFPHNNKDNKQLER